MERHDIIETNKGLAYTLIIIGIILICVTLAMTINAMLSDLEEEAFEWTSVLYFVQGLSLVVIGVSQLRWRKYYIEWNTDEIRYRMPGNKEEESIKIADIRNLEIKLYEVQLQLKDREKVINLEHAQFKSIRRVKDMFEELRSSLS